MPVPDTSPVIPEIGEGSDTTASRLLASAATMFRRKGYSGTTTRELAALLGIQKATLYHHIEKKEDLLYALCMESLQSIYSEVERAMAHHADPLGRLRALIAAHMCITLTEQDKFATMLIELRELSPERRVEVLQLQDRYVALVRDAISTAQDAGKLRADPPAKYQALALLNLLNWSVFWYQPEGKLTPPQLGETLATIFLEGALERR